MEIHAETGKHGGRRPLHRSYDAVGEGIAKRLLFCELNLVCVVVYGVIERIY